MNFNRHCHWLLPACMALCIALPAAAQSDQQRAADFAASLSLAAMQEDLRALQGVADASGGNRAASEPGYEASADYIESQLAGSGLRVWREAFDFPWRESRAQLRVGPGEGVALDVVQIGQHTTPPGGVVGGIALPADQVGCTLDSWKNVDLRGKVALVRSRWESSCSGPDQMRLARQLGAVAMLTYPVIVGFPVDSFPALFIREDAAGEALLSRIAAGERVRARIDTSFREEVRSTFNVLAETPGNGPVVMLGAHLDSVPAGPGMDDNASGAVAVLETARRAATAGLSRRLRFAWWGAEEHGMVGSTRYLQALSGSDPSALGEIRAYLNADMIGSPNYVLALYSPAGEGPASQLRQIHGALADYFPPARTPFITLGAEEDGFTDHMPFRNCGLAYGGVSSFIPGRARSKTAEEQRLFGGVAGAPFSPHYHKASDRLENLGLSAIDALSRALAYGLARLALDPPTAVAAAGCRPEKLNEMARRFRASVH